jgi:nitrite reductase/ring-hydroxylating ferredoxin subunit
MAGGLGGGYGACAAMGARYLFPAHPSRRAWLFVARVDELAPGGSLGFRAPSGQRIAIARQGASGAVEDFVALSSTCPHLGCQVHWEAHNERFFCPCHNGAFDPQGRAYEGPPAEAGQSLPRFPLEVREGSLFIEVPVEALAPARVARAGHDPCLLPRPDGPQHA